MHIHKSAYSNLFAFKLYSIYINTKVANKFLLRNAAAAQCYLICILLLR